MKHILSIALCLLLCFCAVIASAQEGSATAQGFGGEVCVSVTMEDLSLIHI